VDVITALTLLISIVILSVAFKYLDLHIKVSNFMDLQLKAEKNDDCSDEKKSCEDREVDNNTP
jgi:hypothetical protein